MTSRNSITARGPRGRHGYREDLDETPALIESDHTDVEGERPAERNRPIENLLPEDERTPPLFRE